MIHWTFRRPPDDPVWAGEDFLRFTRATVADLRAGYARYPGEPEIESLVTELLAVSERFAEMRAAREVEARGPMLQRVSHPQAGPLEFECQVLHIAETGQRLIVYRAAPGSATEEAFGRLASQAVPGPAQPRLSGGQLTSGGEPLPVSSIGPPPLVTVIERPAAGSVAMLTSWGPPSLLAVSAYGPPGTASLAAPPPVLTSRVSGAAANTIRASPPPVIAVAAAAQTLSACSGPRAVLACSGPVRPSTESRPPSVAAVRWPLISVALTGPPPESRSAPAIPETITTPPWLATAAVTPAGTMMVKPTLQRETWHTGSARVRRPPETDCVTEGGPAPPRLYVIVSVTRTRRTGPAVICTGPP